VAYYLEIAVHGSSVILQNISFLFAKILSVGLTHLSVTDLSVCIKNFLYLRYLHYVCLLHVRAVDETCVDLTDKSEVGTKYINASFIDVSLYAAEL